MFFYQAIFQEMIYTKPFNFNLTLCIAYDSNNKYDMYHCTCLKLLEALMLVM
jgi:hypothetical protein